MKILVFVLVLANLLFFAFTKGYFGRPDNPDAARVQNQLNPDSIRVIARGEPPSGKGAGKKETVAAEKEAAPVEKPEPPAQKPAEPVEKPAAVAAKPPVAEKQAAPEACIAWADLAGGDANRLASLLSEKFAEFRVDRRAIPGEGSGWWVYVPPLPSKADADRKTGELKRMGVNDYFIVQEPGPNRFAISLGVFSNEAGANEHLAKLKAKGIKSAKIGPRLGKDAHQTVEARGPVPRRAALLAAVAAALPETTSQTCK